MFNSLSNTEIKNYAKQLRKEMTRQERHLWYDFLQKHRCKWYKQKPIGRYIADFYCGRIKLIVELDGSQHYEEKQVEYDERRTEYFKNLGITLIRFPNNVSVLCTPRAYYLVLKKTFIKIIQIFKR